MKALVLEEYNRFAIRDLPVPEPDTGEVLIRVKACGICGSDVHGMDGSTGRRIPPLVMGHEASGMIERLGEGVSGYAPGDRVTFDSTVYCGECWFCRHGRINLCDNRRVLGVACEEYSQNGAFAEYVSVPARILYPMPEDISYAQAAMVEPVSIAFHAVERTPLSINDTAVVVGAGMIGLLIVQTLRLKGCGNVIAVDIDDERLALAMEFGADITINSREEDASREIQELLTERGADCAFEAVGNANAFMTAVDCLRKGGLLTLVGNLTPTLDFPLQQIVTREITVYGSCASNGEYPACLDMIARGGIEVDSLISTVAPMSEGASWFEKLYNHEPGLMKVILEP